MKGVWYFNGDSLIINDNGCPKGKFWLTCDDSFFYLLIKLKFDFRFLQKAELINSVINPIVCTYYITCDEDAFKKLLDKYCTKDAHSSLGSDWDLYGSEPGTVRKRLHVFQFDDGDILFSRSEESNDWFYISAPDHFWKMMDKRAPYTELEIGENDRFKNRDDFKLIETDEFLMLNVIANVIARDLFNKDMKRLFEEIKWSEQLLR